MTPRTPSKARLWAGRVLSALPVLMLLFSASVKLSQKPEMVTAFTEKFGFPAGTLVPIAIVEILVAVVYAIPRTAVLGAILVTGYLGGAVATHVRGGEPFVMPIVLGVLAWAGLYLRDPRFAELVPVLKPRAG